MVNFRRHFFPLSLKGLLKGTEDLPPPPNPRGFQGNSDLQQQQQQ